MQDKSFENVENFINKRNMIGNNIIIYRNKKKELIQNIEKHSFNSR